MNKQETIKEINDLLTNEGFTPTTTFEGCGVTWILPYGVDRVEAISVDENFGIRVRGGKVFDFYTPIHWNEIDKIVPILKKLEEMEAIFG